MLLVAGICVACLRMLEAASKSSLAYAVGLATVTVVGVALARWPRLLAGGLALAFVIVTINTSSDVIDRRRTFYGSFTIRSDGVMHEMIHGTTLHGTQILSGSDANRPTTYYSRSGPLGDLMARDDGRFDSVAVVGLGAGTIAAYGRADQALTFYEIDPEVIAMAEDPSLFTYLEDSRADVTTIAGDGRLRLSAAPKHSYDMIVLDAFSSDSIPVHLLTAEALSMYADHLAPGGLLVVHISNRLFDLEPVLAAATDEQGWVGVVGSKSARESWATPSTWAVMSPDPSVPASLGTVDGWRSIDMSHEVAWTDDYSSILSVLR